MDNDLIPVNNRGFWVPRLPPTKSLAKAASLFEEINGEIIIEIGTGIHGEMSGNSVLVWAKSTTAQKIIAIDLEQARLDEVRNATMQYSNVEVVLADGIQFLQNFSLKIDLLYLDFWVPDIEEDLIGTGRSEAYKQAFLAAKYKMNDRSMILIDDTDHIAPWKHTLIVPLARIEGYKVLYTGRQTLLMR
jgi:hypothetical protein